jgi:cell division protein FtsB
MPARRRPSRSALALRWLGVVVLVVIGVAYIHPLRSYREGQDEVARHRADVAALERKNAALAREVARASDDEYIKREARRLGLVRPGERLYIVTGLEGGERAGLR